MKILRFILLLAIVSSCGTANKFTRAAKISMNGVWILKDITYETNSRATYNITILDNISLSCLEDTIWEFIANNNTGSYSLSGSTCSNKGVFNFIWSIPKELYGYTHSVLLKPVDNKMKSTINNKGYRMQLYDLDSINMIWSYDMIVDGQKFTIKMNFEKQ
ncbi:lipocalin [Aquimarina litoralis]|uniref:lipocalin n=1 Tax=Aquimarina litoralis TaxID=584605 RepID=UPI001C5757B9|nr:lipocalin [Aquimarina litoralis]MBW1298358.1 lipocalin [Aquimarina litoralis]